MMMKTSLHGRRILAAAVLIILPISVAHCRAWFPTSTPSLTNAWKSTAMMATIASVRDHANTQILQEVQDNDQQESASKRILQKGTFGNLYEIHLQPSKHAPTIATQVPLEYEGLLTLPKCDFNQDSSAQQRLLCLHRYKIWWMRPVFVPPAAFTNVPPETMFLLYKTTTPQDAEEGEGEAQTSYQLVLPLLFPVQQQAGSAPTSVASSSLRGWKTADEWVEQDNQVMLNSHYPKAVVYIGSHPSDPYALIQEAVEMSNTLLFGAASRDYDDKLVSDQPAPSLFANHLGWCTWNALYIQLSGASIVQAVKEMTEDRKIPIRWMIIDDGWQDVTGGEDDTDGMQWFQQLKGMKEHPIKFAKMSLKECVSTLREQYHMQDVWCWHTLTGYWMGVLPPATTTTPSNTETLEDNDNNDDASTTTSTTSDIPASQLYVPMFSSGLLQNDLSMPREARVGQGIGLPDDPLSFWNAYHSYLRDCGVTGVKVDAQAVAASIMAPTTDDAADANSPLVKSMVLRLQDAVMESVRNNFGNSNDRLLSCMAHAPEIFYFLNKQACWNNNNKPFLRAADDFYPDNPYSHGPHLVACAFNSLLLSQVSRVDWDMFTTRLDPEPWVRVHAVSRCLSGGPLYVSDASDRVVKSVIDWIACKDGTTLPCREAGRPIAECLLRDPLAADSLPFAIFNTNGDADGVTSGVIGAFNVAGSGQWDYQTLQYTSSSTEASESQASQIIRLSPSQIPHFAQDRFAATEFVAVSFFARQAIVLASPTSSIELTLEPVQSEAITFVPLTKLKGYDVASFGFLDTMMNGAGAVVRQEVEESSRLVCHVRGCGRFWWALRRTATTQHDDDISSSLRLQIDGVDQQFRVIAQDDTAVDDDDIVRGGKDVLKAGFVLVSTELHSSEEERTLVLELVA